MPRVRRFLPTPLAVATVAVLALGTAWALLGAAGDERTPPRPPAAIAAVPARLIWLGARLRGRPGRTLDCRTGTLPSAPACTFAQTALPGATLVVPHSGTLRSWAVRGARGDVMLVVLRPREGGAFAAAASLGEQVGDAGVHRFASDVPVDRGDLVGIVVGRRAAIAMRPTPGARIASWGPALAGPVRRPDDGLDGELLLRVGLQPGPPRLLPSQVTGAAAARLPAGEVHARETVVLDRVTYVLMLVRVGDRFALDAFEQLPVADADASAAPPPRRIARIARIAVPDLEPGFELTRFVTGRMGPETGGLDLGFVNSPSESEPGAFGLSFLQAGRDSPVIRSYAINASGFDQTR